jgi:hypothetical protein
MMADPGNPHMDLTEPPDKLPKASELRQLLTQLHSVEYQALTTRATYFITLMAGVFPLIGIYLALVIQLWRPSGISLSVAFDSLLQYQGRRACLLWGNLLVLQVMLFWWGQFLVEQYKIVLYVETDLRAKLRDLVQDRRFWGYEGFLMRGRNEFFATWWERCAVVGAGLGIATACIVLVAWPHSTWSKRWDSIGVGLNCFLWSRLYSLSREASLIRRKWQTALSKPPSRGTGSA